MSKLVPIIIFALAMAFVADSMSVLKLDQYQNHYYIYKNKICVIIMALGMAIFVGLRTNYNDTGAYIQNYEGISPSGSLFSGIKWLEIGDNPGFRFINNCLKHAGISTQNYLMLYAMVTICIYVWFIRKYSTSFWLSMVLFMCMGCYTFSMAAIKQSIAIAFCLVGTDRAIQKKYYTFIFWILIASTFHAYSLMYLIVPVLTFIPWSRYSYFLLLLTGMAGFGLEALLGRVINITTMLGEEYDVELLSGEGVNIYRVAVVWAPVLFSFVVKKHIRQRHDRIANIIINLTMVNAMIMFIGLFGTANYFARLANYFLIFQTVSLPLLIEGFDRKSKQMLTVIIILAYIAYLYYAMGILYGGFDRGFKAISLIEYLRTFS